MFCSKCGKEIADNSQVCGYCGTPVTARTSYGQQNTQNTQQSVYGEPKPSYTGQSQNQSYSYQNGQYQNTGYGAPQNMDGGATGLGIASMVLGIVSLLLSCCASTWWLTLLAAVLSIVFGILSIQKNSGGKGMAIAGIICSIISLVIGIIVLIVGAALITFLAALFGGTY